jgi:putative toxin-antitoxin system antitoxin component (TIGR02293 family)
MGTMKFVPTRAPAPVPGARVLGLKIDSEFEVVERIAAGFSAATIGRLAREVGVPETRMLALTCIPESTYFDRKRHKKPLSAEASSRVYRVAKATEAAEAYFEGDRDAARRWLISPKVAIGGKIPLEFARTPEGSDYVIKLLTRMEHGPGAALVTRVRQPDEFEEAYTAQAQALPRQAA